MKVAVSPYELHPNSPLSHKARKGALLQVTFKDGSVGYSDVHPWPELGDVPIDVQLELLACGHSTPLVQRAFSFARIDADARKAKRNLFAALDIPPSHIHLSDFLQKSKEDIVPLVSTYQNTIKIKMGIVPSKEIALLKELKKELLANDIKLRLDFNCRLSYDGAVKFVEEMQELRGQIDFVEDPFPYHPHKWKHFKDQVNIKLASDLDSLHALSHAGSCDVLVVKPAVSEIYPFLAKPLSGRTLVITSYLDHPIGQLAAAYTAASVAKSHPERLSLCGLITHHVYEDNPFSKALVQGEGRLVPSVKGTGWGYDEELRGMVWRTLS